jgi:hypothetical protein
MVRQSRLSTLRASDELRQGQMMMSAALTLAGVRNTLFW